MRDFNSYDSSDYLTYKKSKMNPGRVQRVEKRLEKARRIAKLSFVTFCIMFFCVVVFIKKYGKRVDIEYGRNVSEKAQSESLAGAFDLAPDNSDKRPIDNRLILIQQEENAPSESKVLPQDRDKNEVISLEHYEMLKAGMDDGETYNTVKKENNPIREVNSRSKSSSSALLPKIDDDSEITIEGAYESSSGGISPAVTKVYSGKFSTFEEAKTAQKAVQNIRPSLVPFIKKVGSIYTLQLGSYTNPDVARSVANSLKTEGIDTWVH